MQKLAWIFIDLILSSFVRSNPKRNLFFHDSCYIMVPGTKNQKWKSNLHFLTLKKDSGFCIIKNHYSFYRGWFNSTKRIFSETKIPRRKKKRNFFLIHPSSLWWFPNWTSRKFLLNLLHYHHHGILNPLIYQKYVCVGGWKCSWKTRKKVFGRKFLQNYSSIWIELNLRHSYGTNSLEKNDSIFVTL